MLNKKNSLIRRSILSNSVSKKPQIKTTALVHRGAYILYLFFNVACLLVVAYQTFLWIKSNTWVKVPTTRLLPDHFTDGQHWENIHMVISWILNIDLAYFFGFIAMAFYALHLYLQFISRKQDSSTST